MARIGFAAALVAILAACNPSDPPRSRALHERAQELDRRLKELAPAVEKLRDELAPLSAQWAYDAHRELESGLARVRDRVAALEAGNGSDWEAMARAADEAIDELAATHDRIRADFDQRAGPS